MPRDQRLYMTFPIDFDEHPKVEGLSDAAFRAFVSMNGYSRRQGLDGVIPVGTARRRWKVKALDELCKSHPERPLVVETAEAYVIRDYAEHQLTTDDIEMLRLKRAEAGSKGGKSSALARANASANGKQPASKIQAESESESELEIDVTYLHESSHLNRPPERDSDPINLSAKLAGIRDLRAVRVLLETTTAQSVSDTGAVMLVQAITSKSKRSVADVDAYVATVCRNSPAEVQQAYFDLDIEAVAS